MNRYLKLVHWEITRFWKMLAALALVTIVLQISGILYETHRYTNLVNDQVLQKHSTIAAFVLEYGKHSFIDGLGRAGLTIYAPIALCIGGLVLYVFFIWYKEWIGKNTFIYRLLTLPTARRNIYFAKLTAILLFVFALVALQLILLPIERSLYMLAGGDTLFESSNLFDLIASNRLLSVLVPRTFIDFIVYYGAGVIVVLIAFTAVLLERSYRLRGIAAAVLYIVAVCLFMALPLLLPGHLTVTHWSTIEWFIIEVALGIVVAAVTVWLGLHLIANKVTV